MIDTKKKGSNPGKAVADVSQNINAENRGVWVSGDPNGDESDLTSWKIFNPDSRQCSDILEKAKKGLITSETLVRGDHKALLPLRVKLTDAAFGMLVEIGLP